MKETFRASMAWLHTWAGLLLGWVLYFMFVTGTAGYLDTEIDRWMQPELPLVAQAEEPAPAAEKALASLAQRAPQADRWFIGLPTGREALHLSIFWQAGKGPQADGDLELDAATGAPLASLGARATGGGQFLYQMHWQLHYLPRAVSDWLVGVAAMFMLVALITGIVVHKKIFADFFTFRPGKGQRSWLDAHNVMSVLTLPFQLMITWSGLVFMMFVYLPLVVSAHYAPDAATGKSGREVFFNETFEGGLHLERAGRPAPLAPLQPMLALAEARWGAGKLSRIDIRYPGDANARVVLRAREDLSPLSSGETLVFDGTNGALLHVLPAVGSTPKAVRDVLLGLHEGLYAGPLLRGLYVLSGLMGAAMIATGLVLWAVKRRQRAAKAGRVHGGLWLVERLNVGGIIGLPVGIAAYFWANRLLPLTLSDRAAWEAHVLFFVWAALLLHAALRPVARAWSEQATVAALAFGLLPVLNALTTHRHLGASLPQGDWVMAGFDLAMLALGAVFAGLARHLVRKARNAARQSASATLMTVEASTVGATR
ncbi:putative iron-regulated membrane protein [Paucibacter oligotrophus]|uniref:Putative iron-regulated membrane protein n=1 Tax=Roseateles oligotrophus TaxID=1769250 RepID=A0A840LBK5_9BURK|nr:PepSY-associated TM helix domain-containing protein [Roseateles oligotrophus]MBB4845111.1 putative iron-regulated membrane protein [Roseateles oligotrophus]